MKAATKPVRRVSGGGRMSIKTDTILKSFPFSQDNGFGFDFLIEMCHKLGFINTFCKQWSGCFRRSPHDGESERSQNTSLRMECFPLDGPMHDVHEVKPWDNFQFLNQKGHCLTVRYCNITVLPHVALPTSIIGRLTNCVC